MTNLFKTNAIVLKKLDYGDTSKIVTLYTEEFGKETAIIKGARSPKSKIGAVLDLMNLVQIVLYRKEHREVQLISQADILAHYPKIKSDLEKLKYGSAILELLNSLTVANEKNARLFKGTVRILELINLSEEDPQILFIKYFLFFIDELGYSLIREECSNCENELTNSQTVYYNYENGFLCEQCGTDHLVNYEFSKELFNLLFCLSRKQMEFRYSKEDLSKLTSFLEKFVIYHIPEFKGIKSFHIY